MSPRGRPPHRQAQKGQPRTSQDSSAGPDTSPWLRRWHGRCEHSGPPPGLTSPPPPLDWPSPGRSLLLLQSLTRPLAPSATPGPFRAWRWEPGPRILRRPRVTSSGWGQLQSDPLPQFPPPGGTLPARWAGVWVGQSCSTGLSGRTPAAGVGTSLQTLIVSFPGLCVRGEEQPQASEGELRLGQLPISQTGAQTGSPQTGGCGSPDRLPRPLALP